MATIVVRVGDYHIGVQVSSRVLADTLREALRPYVVEDPEAPASYAIYAAEPSLTSSRPLYRVYKDCKNLFSTSSLPRAIAVLLGFLSDAATTDYPSGDGQLRLDAVAFVGRSQAVIAPWTMPYRYPSLERRFRRQQIRLLERRSVLIDPRSCELVVAPVELRSFDAVATDERSGTRKITETLVPPGRYPVSAWLLETLNGPERELTRAEAVALGLRVCYHQGRASQQLVRLATFVSGLDLLLQVKASSVGDLVPELLTRH